MIISGISSVVYVAVMVGFLPQMMGAYGSEGLGLSLEVGQVLMMAFLLIAIAFLYSGIIVLISVFAKDTKRGKQLYYAGLYADPDFGDCDNVYDAEY